MEKQKKSEFEKEYMSWEGFKERYLSKIQYLAEILGLDRNDVIRKVRFSRSDEDPKYRTTDEDYMFVKGVMSRILHSKGEGKHEPLLYELRKTDGAEDIFDEVYRLWAFRRQTVGSQGGTRRTG